MLLGGKNIYIHKEVTNMPSKPSDMNIVLSQNKNEYFICDTRLVCRSLKVVWRMNAQQRSLCPGP
jgi:hypothetical protein